MLSGSSQQPSHESSEATSSKLAPRGQLAASLTVRPACPQLLSFVCCISWAFPTADSRLPAALRTTLSLWGVAPQREKASGAGLLPTGSPFCRALACEVVLVHSQAVVWGVAFGWSCMAVLAVRSGGPLGPRSQGCSSSAPPWKSHRSRGHSPGICLHGSGGPRTHCPADAAGSESTLGGGGMAAPATCVRSALSEPQERKWGRWS